MTNETKITALGNIIGGRPYLGQCAARCGTQFHSTHTQVAAMPGYKGLIIGILCLNCAAKEVR